jgi:hypothetical protein
VSTLITKEEQERIDKFYFSPQERAQALYTIFTARLEEIAKETKTPAATQQDIFCFAVEFIGMYSLGVGDVVLSDLALRLNRWLRIHHYGNPSAIYGAPDKPQLKGEKTE